MNIQNLSGMATLYKQMNSNDLKSVLVPQNSGSQESSSVSRTVSQQRKNSFAGTSKSQNLSIRV